MIKCMNCGRENEDSFEFCIDCGSPLKQVNDRPVTLTDVVDEQPAPQKCPNCGAEVPAGFKFCGSCGTKLTDEPIQPPGGGKTMFMHAIKPEEVAEPKPFLITIHPDGTEGMKYNLGAPENVAGRLDGTILFMEDNYVSPKHAIFHNENNVLSVEDANSLNGVFIRIKEQEIQPGDQIRIGRELLRFDNLKNTPVINFNLPEGDDTLFYGSIDAGYWGRLIQILEGGKIGSIFLLAKENVTIGREGCDINFVNDNYVSGTHAQITRVGDRVILKDLDSSNGTYIRIKSRQQLKKGDLLLIGERLLKIDYR